MLVFLQGLAMFVYGICVIISATAKGIQKWHNQRLRSNPREFEKASKSKRAKLPNFFCRREQDAKSLQKKHPPLVYDLSPQTEAKLILGRRAVSSLLSANRVWTVTEPTESEMAAIPHAFVREETCGTLQLRSLPFRANVTPAVLHLPKASYYFLPDRLIWWRPDSILHFSYAELTAKYQLLHFLEREGKPDDSEQHGSICDRFDGASRLPICRYGSVKIAAGKVPILHLITSRPASASLFAESLGDLAIETKITDADCVVPAYCTHVGKGHVPRYYDLGAADIHRMEKIREAVLPIALSEFIWRCDAKEQNYDWRKNARANILVTRNRISACVVPDGQSDVDSNAVVVFRAGDLAIYFFPDEVFVKINDRFTPIGKQLGVEAGIFRFREEEVNPGDSHISEYTWLYVNRDGTRDLRFNGNRKIPIYEYGELILTGDSYFRLHLILSSASLALGFRNAMKQLEIRQDGGRRTSHNERAADRDGERMPPAVNPTDLTLRDAFACLGLASTASFEQATVAYRHLARQNHPDRVADMAPEFRILAEERMRALNRAMTQVREAIGPTQDSKKTTTA